MDFNTTDVKEIYNKLSCKQKQRLKLIIADFSEYNGFEDKYDCIVSCEVLEHIQNNGAFLKKTNDLLVEGGQLILSVPALQKYWAIDDEIAGHYRRYEKKNLFKILLEAGYY